MGSALLEGITSAGVLTKNIIVIEPNSDSIPYKFNVRILESFDHEAIEHFAPDAIIFAIKPQVAESILPDYKAFAGRSLFISIIAGKTIAFFEKHLGSNAAIIRTMPNLPVIIGKGLIIWHKNQNVSEEQSNVISQIFSRTGKHEEIADEAQLDAVTAISGSGPAYVFLFIECLTKAGIELGLDENMAEKLALYTVSGSAELAINSDKPVDSLRKQVTSPKGTTEAALKILMDNDDMQQLISKAADAACKRSMELSE